MLQRKVMSMIQSSHFLMPMKRWSISLTRLLTGCIGRLTEFKNMLPSRHALREFISVSMS